MKPRLDLNQKMTMFKIETSEIQVTEIRFWSCNLNRKIIADNMRQPLSMLYEQKRAIKIKIRKKQ